MSIDKDMIPFNITPRDLYLFHIKGLNGIGEYETKLIKNALRRSYLIGYSQGRTSGEKRIRKTMTNL